MITITLRANSAPLTITLSEVTPPSGIIFSVGGLGVGVAKINGVGGVATINGTI